MCKPKYGLALDWETSGLSPERNQGIAYGAIVYNTSTFEEVDAIYCEIAFDTKYEWTSKAEEIHGLSQHYLAMNGIVQEDAALALFELITKYWSKGDKIMWFGHNPNFDIRFTQQLFGVIDLTMGSSQSHDIQLHHVILDTSATGFITLGVYKSDTLFERIGFPHRGQHNALEDIRQTLLTAKTLRAVFNDFRNAA